jgi:hypothetical protein
LYHQIAQIGWLLSASALGIDLLDDIQHRMFMRMLDPVEIQAEIDLKQALHFSVPSATSLRRKLSSSRLYVFMDSWEPD